MPLNPAATRQPDTALGRETGRVRAALAGRTGETCDAESLAGRFQIQERERHVLRLLDHLGLMPLAGRKILEVGCGTGRWLRDLITWGADPENLFGVELLQAAVARARRLCPESVTIEWGNAAELRFAAGTFDVVLQASVFSSVLDPEMQRAIAAEMLRVMRPHGVILWYDCLVQEPRSSYVRPMRKSEIQALFPDCVLQLHRVTLAAPLTRLLAPKAWVMCSMLSRIPPLCTHYLGAVRRPSFSQ